MHMTDPVVMVIFDRKSLLELTLARQGKGVCYIRRIGIETSPTSEMVMAWEGVS